MTTLLYKLAFNNHADASYGRSNAVMEMRRCARGIYKSRTHSRWLHPYTRLDGLPLRSIFLDILEVR